MIKQNLLKEKFNIYKKKRNKKPYKNFLAIVKKKISVGKCRTRFQKFLCSRIRQICQTSSKKHNLSIENKLKNFGKQNKSLETS